MAEPVAATVVERTVLVCNAGSSSLKLALYDVTGRLLEKRNSEGQPGTLVSVLADYLASSQALHGAPAAILHRVVHAGRVSERLAPLDSAMVAQIRHWTPLAPAHNPVVLAMIAACARQADARQFAVFDSGLYAHLPDVARLYAIPAGLSPRWPIERYGFHGLAHRSQWRTVQRLASSGQRTAPHRLITVHLGNGCSATAWRDDVAVDTSMGFTPLEGLVMGRRSGSIDPGILLHLLHQEQFNDERLNRVLQRESGLAAASGGSGDMRELVRIGSAQTEAAIDQYCYQLRKYLGAFMAALGGVDAISFGGGVGEHQPRIRQQVLEGLEELGIYMDEGRNAVLGGPGILHAEHSRVGLYLSPVDEMDEMFRQYAQAAESISH